MCKFQRQFQKETDKVMLPLLIEDWTEECMSKSNSKKLCPKFELVNIFHGITKPQEIQNISRRNKIN